MDRGNTKHSPLRDEELKAELSGQLGSAGGHREEWVDPEPPADDDPPAASGELTVTEDKPADGPR